MTSARTQVAEVWRGYWDAHSSDIGAAPPSWLANALIEAVEPHQGQRILEAGSGTGGLSAALAQHGASVHALDIVEACVRKRGAGACGVVGDLFRLPYRDDVFDCVFNSGVMEHFEPHDLGLGLREMVRVLKAGGKLVVLVPSERGRFYVAGKRRQEAAGTWEYGAEYPQGSLEPYLGPWNLTCQEERLIGVRWQTRFLDGWRRRAARLMTAPFSENSRLGAALFGGYLLLSVWRKP